MVDREKFPAVDGRPYTIYNVAMSLDGRTSTVGGDSTFSGAGDWLRVHELRHSVDGICVGITTVLDDDPKLHTKFIDVPHHPHRIVVDSRLRIPLAAELLHFCREGVDVFVGTTQSSLIDEPAKARELENIGATCIPCGPGPRVDLLVLWGELKASGIDSVLVEGGGTVAGSLFRAGLVDEVRAFIAPVIVAGEVPPATAIVMDPGYKGVAGAIKLQLVEIAEIDDGFHARYLVKK